MTRNFMVACRRGYSGGQFSIGAVVKISITDIRIGYGSAAGRKIHL